MPPPTPLYRRKPRRAASARKSKSGATVRIEEPRATEAMPSHHNAVSAKALGAYYTEKGIATFLTRWALRTPSDTVLDPSAGGGAFLAAAAEQIIRLGGNAPAQICGVEVDAGTCSRVEAHFATSAGWTPRLYCEDFFRLRPRDLGEFDTLIGNPPFIRYQHFTGAVRDRALGCAARQGVKLNRLASSWAPFLVHAGGFVKGGGRLAMVLPQELLHASYARPVLAYLAAAFRRVNILRSRRNYFRTLTKIPFSCLPKRRRAATRTVKCVCSILSAPTRSCRFQLTRCGRKQSKCPPRPGEATSRD
ncbi:MAG: N-6 DNA methylase [Chthoniobacterales bacterium]|nr:N-6 DNA methylase [Chthoniobacterales bacterium]